MTDATATYTAQLKADLLSELDDVRAEMSDAHAWASEVRAEAFNDAVVFGLGQAGGFDAYNTAAPGLAAGIRELEAREAKLLQELGRIAAQEAAR